MALQLYCGETMCKQPVTAPPRRAWPLHCAACGTALYPADVIERARLDELEMKRAPLMTETRGARVAVTSAHIESGTAPANKPAAKEGDRPATTSRSARRSRPLRRRAR